MLEAGLEDLNQLVCVPPDKRNDPVWAHALESAMEEHCGLHGCNLRLRKKRKNMVKYTWQSDVS